METKEIFKDIPGYEGYYQVSDRGRVKSLNRIVIDSRGVERFYKGRVIQGTINKGYRQFNLRINNKSRIFTASQLVAKTFLGHSVNGNTLVVDHINGVKTDDRLSNLRIVSHRENNSTCFRKDRQTLSSKFTGVYWSKDISKWVSRIQYEDKLVYLGCYDNEIDASNAYQKALAKVKDNTFNPDEYKPKWSSKFKGIYFQKRSKKWTCQARINGKQKHIGYFNTELEAHQALQKFKKDNNKLIDKET